MKQLLFLLSLMLIVACTDNDIYFDEDAVAGGSHMDSEHKGMVRVPAMGVFATLGTSVESAPVKERPKMVVSFSYDFSIGVHEEMGKDSLPIVNVTFYDAVLYANERSKKEGYDTAYVYTTAVYDDDGNCINLRGFEFKPDVDAYRLPTEAEWALVAKQDWNPDSAWNSENSGFKRHKVCTADKNKMGVCDMAGNVTEWVNDWMGYFKDTTFNNYAGASDGGSIGERVIKGGCFKNTPKTTKLYSRGDVYTVVSSSKSDYLGFRLAFGRIPEPVWTNASGKPVVTLVVPKASTEDVRKHAGTNNVRIAYRNDVTGDLAFIDYRWSTLYSAEVADSLDVYHPMISPDGEWVAFSTGFEGVKGLSELYVQKLNVFGTGRVKLKVKSAAIPRWRVLDNGDTVIVYVSDAGTNKDEATWKGKSTWQVPFSNGQFGTPEKLMDGSFHGGISDDGKLAVTGSSLLRTRMADSGSTVFDSYLDSVWYNGEQACNVSLSSGNSKKTMFLDFGSKTGKDFVGSSYAAHERLFVADSVGNLIRSLAAPNPYTFDHVEWAMHGENLAVATLTNMNGAHTKIVLIDFSDSSVTDLAEGDEIWHPSMWNQKSLELSPESELDLDSSGMYANEEKTNLLLTEKISLFWKLRDSIEILCLGNSHMNAGVNPIALSKYAFNLAVYPCDMHCNKYLFENYALNHCSKMKYVVVGLDFDLWPYTDEKSDYKEHFESSKGFVYDANHDFWKDGLDPSFLETVDNNIVFDEDFVKIVPYRGWAYKNISGSWYGRDTNEVEIRGDSTWSDDSKGYESNISDLEKLLAMAKKNDITVIGVVFPVSPGYAKTGSYSRHGMRRSHAKNILNRLKKMAAENENFVILDENKMGSHDYTDEMALDYDHLNVFGARQLSYRLDSLIQTLK
ncbi:MAG: TIGR02171 family protein [Fibrobacter sp.]|nr:TIGR02171 family protein [Fibrobacter sp.]